MAKDDIVIDTYHGRVRHEVLELVPDGNHKVLDVGGGVGSSIKYLKDIGRCREGVVVDLVADACLPEVDAAFAGDLNDTELLARIGREQGQFDIILGLDVFEHLVDPWATVAACQALLTPGGAIIASIPNARNYQLVLPLVFKGEFELTDAGIMDRTHLRWFVKKTAIELMTGSGLTLEHVERKIYGRKKNLANKLTLGVFKDFLALQYFIRAGKLAEK